MLVASVGHIPSGEFKFQTNMHSIIGDVFFGRSDTGPNRVPMPTEHNIGYITKRTLIANEPNFFLMRPRGKVDDWRQMVNPDTATYSEVSVLQIEQRYPLRVGDLLVAFQEPIASTGTQAIMSKTGVTAVCLCLPTDAVPEVLKPTFKRVSMSLLAYMFSFVRSDVPFTGTRATVVSPVLLNIYTNQRVRLPPGPIPLYPAAPGD